MIWGGSPYFWKHPHVCCPKNPSNISWVGCQVATCFDARTNRGVMNGGSGVSIGEGDGFLGCLIVFFGKARKKYCLK